MKLGKGSLDNYNLHRALAADGIFHSLVAGFCGLLDQLQGVAFLTVDCPLRGPQPRLRISPCHFDHVKPKTRRRVPEYTQT